MNLFTKTPIFITIIFLIIINNIDKIQAQIIYDDVVPFVQFHFTVKLKEYNNQMAQEKILDYSSKKFKKPPQVILGIGFYNNIWNPTNKNILFELTSSEVTNKKCTIKLISDNQSSYLYGISANVFIIDTSQFPFIQVFNQSKTNIQFNTDYQFSETRTYSSDLQGKKNAIVIVRGWKSSIKASENKSFSLNVFITKVDETSYKINFVSNKSSIQINDVYYTIIEHVENPPGIYGVISNYDQSYKAPTSEKCFKDIYCNKESRYFIVNFKVVNMQLSNQQSDYVKFFTSINQFEFETVQDGQDPRIFLQKFQFMQDTIQYSYSIWDKTVCYGSTSSSIFFYRKTCSNSQYIDASGTTCTPNCNIVNTENIQMCLDCLSGQYYLKDKQICQQQKPMGYACTLTGSFYQCQDCKIDNCNECIQKNSISCDKYSDDRIYQNQDCHFSCSKCYIPNKDYGCQECSSNTRQLQKMTGSCSCKTGYKEVGVAECQDQSALEPNIEIQNANNKLIQILFLAYLPQLFLNMHPYVDYFIIQMQQLGNLYFINQNTTTTPNKSFIVLNYFNIYSGSASAEDTNIENVPFVFFKSQILLKKYGDRSIKQEQLVDYSSKNFKSAPIVILGIGYYNNKWNPEKQILFNLNSSFVTKTNCTIQLISDNNSSYLYGIQANLLAIDITQFPFVNIKSQTQINIKFDSKYQFIEKRKYSPELQGKKNAIVVINGWKSSPFNSQNQKFSLNVFVTIIDDQNYTITISTSQHSQTIVDVYYTIIEYVTDPPSMYGVTANYEENYKANTTKECFYSYQQCNNKDRFFPVQFDVVKMKISQAQEQDKFFASINQFDFETKQLVDIEGTDPRIQLVNLKYQESRCYCGNGFFGTNCKQSCNHSCILCQDNLSCDKYSDERIYKNQDCHFSCSKCYIPSKTYGCEQCGSNTRELQKITGTCICKTGFREIGEAECKDEKFLEPNKEVQNTNNKIIQALFFINLPQLFINIHPYGDFFLFQMQQLGNFYFQNQNSTTSPFKSFTILNFFNIYYQKPQAQDKTTEIVFGIAFKSNVDKTSSQNLLLLTIILILFALFSIITLPQTQTIDYSSKQFKNPPLVIVGIGFYNNKFDPKDKQILFELTSSSITNSQCDIQLISDAATSYLTGIQANVLVIDKSQFPFVNVIYQKQQNINFDNNYQFQEKRQYSLNLQGNKSAIVIIRGWKSSSKTSSNSSFSLHVFVQNIDDQNYTITITTSKSSLTIIDVYYTIIEYQTNPTSQYGIISNYDQSYQSPTKQTCFSSKSCKNEKRYFPVNFKVVNIQKISSPYYNFFISINQFQFTTENYETDPRLELTKQQINKDTINYSYHTWDDSICTGSTTSSLFFYRKVCQNNQYFNIIANTCISSCQITNPQNNQLCLDCSSGQYFLQDKQICQSKKPAGYICSQINSFYTCQNCKIDNCQECQDVGSSQFNCVQCLSQYYLYKNQCSIKQPDNTNCNDKFICSACNDTNCLKCILNSSNDQQCLDCPSGQYFLQDKQTCQSEKPAGYICSQISLFQTCQNCKIDNCQECQDAGFFGIDCKQSCIQSCILCQDSLSCDKYSDERIYQKEDCHFSCQKCYIPNKDYACQECSSETRELEQMTGSCFCKAGYTDIGIAECQDNKALKPNDNFSSTSSQIVQVLFIAYLPQLLINIHPYADYFIFQMQSLGNLYFVNQNSTIIPFKSFTVINFLNIYYKSSEVGSSVYEQVFGIKYKLIIDKIVSYNLLIVAIVLILFTLFSIVVFLFRSKITSTFIINTFLWNSQLKLIRIFSNYFLINLFLNLSNFSEMESLSFILLGILGSIYLLNLVICFQKSRHINQQMFKFLYDNLNTNNIFNRYFWIIIEIKKIVCVICLSLAPMQIYYYLFLSISFLFGLVLIKFKPHLNQIRDLVFLIISELFVFCLTIFPLLMEKINDYSIICSLTNTANIISIIYSIFQLIITAEYILRRFIQYRRQKSKLLSSQNFCRPFVVDMALEINIEKLDDILNYSRLTSTQFKNKSPSRSRNKLQSNIY
ncbi:hypothetical protein ABPG74_009532 [Tetrahymena malaccensis]